MNCSSAPQLCSNGAECLQGVADGSIDVYISTSGGAAGIFPYVQVLDLPYLMSGDRVAEAVLAGDFTRKMRDMALADSDGAIRLMTIGNTGGWRNFANTKRVVRNPGDLAGLKSVPLLLTCRRNWSVPSALPRRLFHGLSCSRPSRPALLKGPRTASPTSWA